ncbi:tRNA1(Val) (adenine(37)-N6)-methyltransferase [Bacteroides sp. UBA939]|uniref:tRNA1(Val) (adenine(37)-N6)-methyltransferase n=1 Tax=Bacteroides sp. UBA939 TaxID=1946092 RepID=UPI0025C15670|nr:tRNA1(Val) (adenine(37)-N6)-methyltransferase [Bacteroides sp. UBA939]
MSNPYFQFKQFTVWHDKCAMKVGTDGVLLGAWASVDKVQQILDVGTGTGLIALLLAQRNMQAQITALEIDEVAASQAEENIARSPWSDRVKVVCADFRLFHPESKYDLIISNPPYFVDALNCPDKQRNMARHTCELNYELLFRHSAKMLQEQGSVCVIIPAEVEKLVIDTAWKYKLFPSRSLRVFTKPGKPCRRVLLSFSLQENECINDILCIEETHHQYTPEYIALTREFYLNM